MAMAASLLSSPCTPSWSVSPVVLRKASARPIVAFSRSSSSSLSSVFSSPFTESNSPERYQRDCWFYQGASLPGSLPPPPPQPPHREGNACDRENDIALQLPELKRLLELLRESRGSGVGGSTSPVGSVALVGTGPGDPELLTLKAVRAIEAADLILYDRLVSHDVLRPVRPDARLLYVGKTAGYHGRTQEEIHELLLNAEAEANVVRLKRGDPLVFGRGGGEIDFSHH